MNALKDVLELGPKGADISPTDKDEPCQVVSWRLDRNDLPESLSKVLKKNFGDFEELFFSVMVTVATKNEKWPNSALSAHMSVDLDGEIKQTASFEQPIGRLWKSKHRKGLTFHMPIIPTQCDYKGFCLELFNNVLVTILEDARAIITWDDKGLAVTINFGATYISTREHSL